MVLFLFKNIFQQDLKPETIQSESTPYNFTIVTFKVTNEIRLKCQKNSEIVKRYLKIFRFV